MQRFGDTPINQKVNDSLSSTLHNRELLGFPNKLGLVAKPEWGPMSEREQRSQMPGWHEDLGSWLSSFVGAFSMQPPSAVVPPV